MSVSPTFIGTFSEGTVNIFLPASWTAPNPFPGIPGQDPDGHTLCWAAVALLSPPVPMAQMIVPKCFLVVTAPLALPLGQVLGPVVLFLHGPQLLPCPAQ